MSGPRLLLLTETFRPEVGGGETQARVLAESLAARGHRVTIVTRHSRADLLAEERGEVYAVRRVGPRGRGRWRKWGLTLTILPVLLSPRTAVDTVLVSGFRILGVPAVLAARLRGLACVLKADSAGEMSGEYFRAGLAQAGLSPRALVVRASLALRNAILRRADAFVALSREIECELVVAGVPATRIHRIPNGVDVTHFVPARPGERATLRRTLGLPDGPLVVYTGRLVTYKGLPLLLRVWGELVRDGEPGTLVLVGAGGADMHDCEESLRSQVRADSLGDRVRFTGAVPDVAPHLRAADAFVFPTENEAFGLSLVEAMACGLPVVSTTVGGIADFLRDGENGIVVPVGDADRLAAALRRVVRGGPELAALGRAARATVERDFSRETVAEAYGRLLNSLGTPTVEERA